MDEEDYDDALPEVKRKKVERAPKFQIRPEYVPGNENDSVAHGKHVHAWVPFQVWRWAKRRHRKNEKLKMAQIRKELVRAIWLYGGAWLDNDSWPMTSQRLQVIVSAHRETIGKCLHQLWALGWIDLKNVEYSNGRNAGQIVVPREVKEKRFKLKFNKIDKKETTVKINSVGESPTEKEKNLRRLSATFKHGRESLKKLKESPQPLDLKGWGEEALLLLRIKTGNKNLRVTHAVANRFVTSWEAGLDPSEAVERLEEKHWACPVVTGRSKNELTTSCNHLLGSLLFDADNGIPMASKEALSDVSYHFRNTDEELPWKSMWS